MSEEMPTSPNDMPWNHSSENPNWRWNTIATLNQFSCVDIHWENDWRESNRTGEPAGEWDVMIETGQGKQFKACHENIENALWFVTTLAENSDSEHWKKQEESRKSALGKLTPEERKLLRL